MFSWNSGCTEVLNIHPGRGQHLYPRMMGHLQIPSLVSFTQVLRLLTWPHVFLCMAVFYVYYCF